MSDTAATGNTAFWQRTDLQIILRLILGGVFLQSGYSKLGAIPQFARAVQDYNLLPADLAYFYAHALPWVEIIAGAYLLLGLFMPFASIVTGLMLVSFLIAIGFALVSGKNIDCGCMIGGKQEPVSWMLFLRDVLMLLGCVYLYKARQWRYSLDNYLAG